MQQALMHAVSEQEARNGFVLDKASATGWQSMRPEFRGRPLHELVLMSYEERD